MLTNKCPFITKVHSDHLFSLNLDLHVGGLKMNKTGSALYTNRPIYKFSREPNR